MFYSKKLKFFGALIAIVTIYNIFRVLIPFERKFRKVEKFNVKIAINRKISWEDIDFINYEKTRLGPGENGQNYVITDPQEIAENEAWVVKEGFYVGVSNNISYTRALRDLRPEV